QDKNSIPGNASPDDARISTIVIDLDDKNGMHPAQVEKYNALKKGQFFRLRIEGVNTYLYEVSIGNHDVETSADLPGNLLDLVDLGGLNSALDNLSSVGGVVREFVTLEASEDVQGFNAGEIRTAENLKSYFAGVQSAYLRFFSEINDRYAEIDALFARSEKYRNTMTTVEKGILGKVPLTSAIKADLETFDVAKAAIFDSKGRLAEQNAEYSEVVGTNRETIEQDRALKVSAAEIKKVHDTLAKACDNLLDQLSAENYAKFSDAMIEILNNLDFSYTTLPIQRYSDVNEIEISLKPRDRNAKLSGYSTVLRIPDIEKSFWGISTGFYVTGNPQRNYSLIAREENGQTLYDFLEEDAAEVELGINTMVRYGRRIGEVFDTPSFWHFGFGAGLGIDQKFKPRLMAGTGLAFGHQNKLIVDIGAIHMYYDTLSRAYNLEGNTTLPEDFLVNATKIQGYISLGYLIGL
ncbi:MAG TPA: hypothetical protein VFM69_13275, partial [Pricia sp.]|nr:hypothetical protein [Pricia sp.]